MIGSGWTDMTDEEALLELLKINRRKVDDLTSLLYETISEVRIFSPIIADDILTRLNGIIGKK